MIELRRAAAPPPPPPPAAAAIAPGRYLQLRRTTAGLTIDQLANLFCSDSELTVKGKAARAAEVRNAIQLLEADSPVLTRSYRDTLVGRLRAFFRFDAAVYATLQAYRIHPGTTVPKICRGCGCTWDDACQHKVYGNCAWSETPAGQPPLCTHCELGLRSGVPHAA
jgi:hypothetical protein